MSWKNVLPATAATIVFLLNPVIFSPISSYGSTGDDDVNGGDGDDVDFNVIGYKLARPCMEVKTLDTLDEDLDSASKRETLEMCHSNMLYLKGQCEGSLGLMKNFCESGGEMMVDEYLEFYSIENEPRPTIPEWLNEEDTDDAGDTNDQVSAAQTTEFSIYEDPEGRFMIRYPSDSFVNEEPNFGEEIVVKFDMSEPEIVGDDKTDITKPGVWIMILPDKLA